MPKTLEEHYGYLSDRVKLKAYESALNQTVKPGDTVLDLGCGSGLLGLMALRAGAGKVLFVEEGEVIEAARRAVADAGFGDKAEYFQGNSFEIELPEPADLIVSDHVGYFGFDYGVVGLLSDAKKRFLKPGGVVIPAAVDLHLAPVESDDCRNLVAQWQDGSVPADFEWLGASAANSKHSVNLSTGDPLAASSVLDTLKLGQEAAAFMSWSVEFRCERDGMLDGLAGWFDCQLVEGTRMTNSPVAAESLDRPQAFLPIDTPVPVKTGDIVKATVMVRHEDGIIGWVVEIPGTDQRFNNTTFNGLLLDTATMNRARPDRIAQLSKRGRARQVILSYCDGQRTLADVEALIQQDHADLFPSTYAMSTFVRQVLQWDTSE